MLRRLHSLLICAFALVSLAAIGGCEGKPKPTDFTALYDKAMTLKHGQTEAEVIALMGEPLERSGSDPENGTRLIYSSEKATGNNIMVVIKDGKVFSGVATRNGTVTPFGR